MIRRRLAGLAVAAALAGGTPAVAHAVPAADAPRAVTSKSCGGGWTHASLSWGHKCLRRGQFCKASGDREYHRYGFHCHKRDARGNYHLT